MPVDPDVLRSRISEVRLCLSELRRLVLRPFKELSLDERYSMRYNLIVLVESLVSLCMHICIEAYDFKPGSYREAVRIVSERLCLRNNINSLIGLRNILVHRYWRVDDERVYFEVKENFKSIEELLGKVEEVFLV